MHEPKTIEDPVRVVSEIPPVVCWIREIPSNQITYISKSYEKLLGREIGDLKEAFRSFVESIHPADREMLLRQVQCESELGEETETDYRIFRPDGTMRWVHSQTVVLRNEAGQAWQIIGFARDTTDRMLAEERRRTRDDALRSALVKEVNHRIKNNLQSVVLLLQHHAENHTEIAAIVKSAITRVNSIAVMCGLHGVGGRHEIELCEMVNAIAKSLEGFYPEVSTAVQIHGDLSPTYVENSESVPVALILNELILNAVKHFGGTAGKPVRITLEHSGPAVCVTIVNPGGSLPQPFEFAKGIGLGTGLKLVKLLLPPVGVEIRTEDAPTGVVTTIVITPPMLVEQPTPDGGSVEPHHE